MASKTHSVGMARMIAPTLLLSSMVFVALLYVNAQYPHLMAQIKLSVGGSEAIPSINSVQTQEGQRLRQIDALLISPRNKQDLREGRPFWGAAVHMVELAFMGPSDDATIRSRGNRMFEFHRFGFAGNREPVVMEFHDNVLTCVHYPQRTQTSCSAGVESFYAGQPFPFTYRVAVGN